MQVPRGRFTAMKKGTRIHDLLVELKHSRFSGYCIITRGTETGSLVLKNGHCFLAGYQDLAGEDAWASIQRFGESEVDAQLMHLTPAQLELALEFNEEARIERRKIHAHGERPGAVPGNHTAEERRSRARIPESPKPPDTPVKDTGAGVSWLLTGQVSQEEAPHKKDGTHPEEARPPKPVHGGGPAQVRPDRIVSHGPDTGTRISSAHQDTGRHAPSLPGDLVMVHPGTPPPGTEPGQGTPVPPISDAPGEKLGREGQSGFQDTPSPVGEGEEKSPNDGFIRELSALDTMDLQGMTEKIRINCRAIVQGLHLEHLLDRQEDKPE